MGLEINGSTANVRNRTINRPERDDNSQSERAGSRTGNQSPSLFETFLRPSSETLSDVYASRTGLSTEINAFGVRNRAANQKTPRDTEFDGHFVGANGRTFSPDTPLSGIPAVTPGGGVRNDETLIYVNGIKTNVRKQAASLQAIADRSGSRVVGIHNATQNSAADILQSLGDKLDIGGNPAVDTLADTVYDELRAGREVHLLAHSQGAIITSRALQDVKIRLMAEDGMSRRDAERLMNNIKVETFGGAARRFPDGPRYVHYVNRNDVVPLAFGLRSWLNPFARAGRAAVTHYFREGRPLASHGFEKFYLPERVSFEQARRGNFN
ncbi:MAG TPA: alpha/beta hydrolase [Pyrinomonadaceae bacterium]|nr:alpha/beta hydrolase [Pyrinomonadaceae bacterium]